MEKVNDSKSVMFLLKEMIEKLEVHSSYSTFLSVLLILFGALLVSYLVHKIMKKVFLYWIERFILKTKSKYDDFFVSRKVISRLTYFAPVFVFYLIVTLLLKEADVTQLIMVKLSKISLALISAWVIVSLFNALLDIYNTFPFSRDKNIDGYIQVIQLLFWLVAILIIVSIVFNVELYSVFTGLGAVAAVLILVFKDTILGFVASIQLSVNKMVKKGDWITMSSYNADGTVLEISLNTVKVQNWDKTITTIPTYALVSSSFNNWKGMEESGGRRIKRSINIDMNSVQFCTKEMLDKFQKIQLLTDYIGERITEIEQMNASMGVDDTVSVNGRRLTNIGVFRKYLELYLHQNPLISDEMTFLVRHLQSTEKGIPIEVYVFSKEQNWAKYESIQADVFDHILAVVPEFGLRVYQLPSGYDLFKGING